MGSLIIPARLHMGRAGASCRDVMKCLICIMSSSVGTDRDILGFRDFPSALILWASK